MTSFNELRAFFDEGADKKRGAELQLRQESAEFNYFIARAELTDAGTNLAHGFSHLAELIAVDPSDPEWLGLIDEYVARTSERDSLLEPEDGQERYFAPEALRAYLLGQEGRLDDAVAILNQVHQAVPDLRYLHEWVLDWLEPEGGIESLDVGVAFALVDTLVQQTPEYRYVPARDVPILRRFAALARRVTPPAEFADNYRMLLGGLYRRCGLFDEAVALLREAEPQNWQSVVAEGLVRRQQGKLKEAEQAFVQAAKLDPEDISAYLEAADMFLERRHWSRALHYYEVVLKREQNHPWAYPSALWCRWRAQSDGRSPDDHFPEELTSLAQGGNDRAAQLFGEFFPWQGYLPQPADAISNVIRQVLEPYEAGESKEDLGEFKVSVSAVEAPSNAVALDLACRRLGVQHSLVVRYTEVGTPDPREPIDQPTYIIWRKDGEVLVPAMPEPHPKIAEVVSSLASAPYDPQALFARASRIAAKLNESHIPNLLACVCHPPELPNGIDVFDWIPRVHLGVTNIISWIGEGWEDSARKRALYSILLGPMDWSTEAAILSLTSLAKFMPRISCDVHNAFARLRTAIPSDARVCYEECLYSSWQWLPGVYPNEQAEFREELKRIREQE